MTTAASDSHNCPLYGDTGGPLTSEPKELLKTPTPFDSTEQFRRNMISLSWRCLTNVFSLSLLILGLRIFSQKGELSHKEQRGFNAITILSGAFTSLGLGSMLGYLGSMLRWRLLARKKYKMQDIELLLAMPSPSGSAALLFTHLREWRLSLTTFIVMLYLVINISGRFSVAIFGLTYNLVDISPQDLIPTIDWTSSVLLVKNATDFEAVEKSRISYSDFVQSGLATFGYLPDVKFDTSVPQSLTPETLYSIGATPSLEEETNNTVSFKHPLHNYVRETIWRSDQWHSIQSSANCTMFRLDGSKYWKDYGSDNQISKDWKDERNGETMAEVLRVLDSQNAWPRGGAEKVTWAAPLFGNSDGSSVTYVVYRDTAWECASRLFETLEPEGGLHPEPLFDSATLFLLPIVERVRGRRSPELMTSLDGSCSGPLVGMTARIAYRSFGQLESRLSPSVGVQTLNFYQNGTGGSATQKYYYNIYVAALIARLPIIAIIYGETVLPSKYTQDKAHHDQEPEETRLEVKWDRVYIVASTIVATQILAITAVLYYCRDVYVREDSYLATAELLKTVLNEIDNGSTMTTKKLGDALDEALEGPVSYGTIPGLQGDQPIVALGCKVDNNFPGFPPFRKCSIFRRRSRS